METNDHRTKKNFGKALTIVLLATTISGLTYHAVITDRVPLQSNIPPQIPHQEPTSIPPFTSAVDGVQITSARIVPDSASSAALEVDVINTTSKAVKYLILSSGSSSHGLGGGTVIEPSGTVTTKFVLANLQIGKPLSVAAIAWEDGTFNGSPLQIELARKSLEKVAIREAAR